MNKLCYVIFIVPANQHPLVHLLPYKPSLLMHLVYHLIYFFRKFIGVWYQQTSDRRCERNNHRIRQWRPGDLLPLEGCGGNRGNWHRRKDHSLRCQHKVEIVPQLLDTAHQLTARFTGNITSGIIRLLKNAVKSESTWTIINQIATLIL